MRYAKRTIFLACLLAMLLPTHVVFGQRGDSKATSRGSVRLPEVSGGENASSGTTNAESARPAETKKKKPSDEMVYLNVQDQDIKDVIRQISKATGKNFIIDDKIRGKVTIMSENMMTKEQAYQAFLSALEVAGYTIVTGPGGIIKVISLKKAISSPIPTHVDSTPYTDSYVTRLISLQNISALDMSKAIKGLISKSGNMFAYPATNTLIITDSGTNIDRLMKIIKELDQEGPQQVLEIIPINYAEATEVAQMVLSLFEIQQAKTTSRRTTRRATAELEEIKDVSKIIADERTNSIIVVASKRAISRVRSVIAKLDVPMGDADSGKIHVHYLQHANAPDLAATLSSLTSGVGKSSAKSGKKGASAAGAVAQLEGGISIGADETTNALIITASAKDYKTLVKELIAKLDIPRRQVYLEAVIMELGIKKSGTYGVSGFGGAGNSTMLGFGNLGYSDPAMNALSGMFDPTSFFATPGILGGLLSRDTVTLDVPQSGGGTTQLSIPSFAAFLNLLQTYQDSNLVSTPNILTLDNQKASMEVSRTIYVAKTTQSAQTGFQTVEPTPLEAVTLLDITPQITEGDTVKLEIHTKLETFTGTPGPAGISDKAKREITTTVVVSDGQTVVLGGLMEDNISHTKSKVPILGDIPLIGFLFRSSKSQTTKNNLLVFVTPYIIRDPSDFSDVSRIKIEQRNRFIDQNFGKKQRRAIRETIAMHRADLLEFSEKLSVPNATVTPGATAQPIPGSSTRTTPMSSSSTPPGTTSNTRSNGAQPVITVQPVGKQVGRGKALDSSNYRANTSSPSNVGSPNLKGSGKVDRAY
jgi:general secretion pathway protein D